MKHLMIAFICLLSLIGEAQTRGKYLIIDRKLKHPISSSDTITEDQMKKGFFAVEKQNIDSILKKFQFFSSKLREVARYHIDETKIEIGSTSLTTKVIHFPFADRLNVALSTDTGNGHDREFYIVDSKMTNNDNARYLNKLIAYIKKGL
jgi:hypothetical protein